MGTEPRSDRTVKVRDVEELIKSIQGVTDCRVVINDWGAVEEVHVLAGADRPAKGVARDVESALAARFGMNIDHKKISVAQLGSASPLLPQEYRLRIKGHRLEVNQPERTCALQVDLLTPLGTVVSGEATGPSERRSLIRMAGQATIQALATMIAEPRRIGMEEVAQVSVGGRELIVALVTVATQRESEVLVGTAPLVTGDEIGSAVKACLDAVNRRISLFLAD